MACPEPRHASPGSPNDLRGQRRGALRQVVMAAHLFSMRASRRINFRWHRVIAAANANLSSAALTRPSLDLVNDPIDLSVLRSFVGTTTESTQILDPFPARALGAALGGESPAADGDVLGI